MPTKSSERWIADGNNIKKQLEAAGYKVDLQYAEDDIPTQVTQVENMVTKGDEMLVIAAIDGTALGDVLRRPRTGHPGHRLRPPDPRHRRGRLLHHLRQLQGRRAAGRVARRGPRRPAARPPYNVELFAGSPDDNNATFFFNGAMTVLKPMIDSGDIKVVVRPDRLQDRSPSCAGTRPRPRSAWRTSSPRPTRRRPSTACSRRTTACRSASSRRSRATATAAAARSYPVVTGQDAEVAVGQVDPRRRAVLHDLQGHPRARQGHRRHDQGRSAPTRSPRSTTPRPTTTASRSCRRTCSTR